MKVLFIGGTGIISSACTPLAADLGIDLTLMNRGKGNRAVPPGVKLVQADIRRPDEVRAAIEGKSYDSIVQWIAFTPEHVETDIDLFSGRTGQYVFISSASAYQTPAANLPITESTILDNPHWEYSRNKIACEERLVRAYRETKFPFTIVRPSHTYDERSIPFDHGYTVVDRMRRGLPVVVHGDGTSLWTLTHHADFAKGFVPLLGNERAVGEALHITSDEWLSWDQIYDSVASAAGCKAVKVHIPSEIIARVNPGWGAALLGDKANSSIFDNSKVKRLAPDFRCTTPFSEGARQIMAWYDADPSRQVVSHEANQLHDSLIAWSQRS